jgi:hypothetical protein
MPNPSKSFYFNITKDSNNNDIKQSTITYPAQTSGPVTFYSDPEKASGYYNGFGIHTVTYTLWPEQAVTYSPNIINNFSGDISIEASLKEEPLENDWFELTETKISVPENGYSNKLINFQGNYVWIRAKVTISAGILQQILFNFQ